MPFPGTELSNNIAKSSENKFDDVSTIDWAEANTFAGTDIWKGNASRRKYIIQELWKLHYINDSVLPYREVERLEGISDNTDEYFNTQVL